MQLPRAGPRPRGDRGDPRVPGALGHPPELVAHARQPALYEQIEGRLAELLGAEDTLLLPTLTHIHASVIPLLAGSGTILLDSRAHKTIYDGCTVARANGASLASFPHNEPEALAALLRKAPRAPRLICMDGVNSMTGNPPRLAEFAALAREHDALLYVDDAHGFGVVGERAPDEPCPYGRRGNGVVRHLGERYDNVVFTAGFSKAYSSLLAFVACPSDLKHMLKVTAAPYLYSGPSPIASLASALVGLQINDARGDRLRARIHAATRRILDHLATLGVATRNASAFPIVEVPLEDADDLDLAGRFLFDHGIYVTLAFYPGVPRDEVGFGLQAPPPTPTRRWTSSSKCSTGWPPSCRCAARPSTRSPPDYLPSWTAARTRSRSRLASAAVRVASRRRSTRRSSRFFCPGRMPSRALAAAGSASAGVEASTRSSSTAAASSPSARRTRSPSASASTSAATATDRSRRAAGIAETGR